MLNRRADKLELIRIVEAVATEKSIDKDLIISSMETGIEKAAKSRFGTENEIKVQIDRLNGDINISDSNTKPADNLSSLNFTTHLNVGFKSGINSLDLSALNMADLLTIPNLVLVALVTEISTSFSIPIETSISFFKSSSPSVENVS